jgi:DNA-binding transcriptional ArsR family regulator
MRATHTIESIFGTRSRVRVLDVLRGVKVPLNASEIARRTRLSQPAATTALVDLERMGVVDSYPSGRARIYWLDRDNVYSQQVIEAAFAAQYSMPEELEADLRRLFAGLCSSVVLFGSYARGSQAPGSDVDVLLVAKDAESMTAVNDRYADEMVGFSHRWGAQLSVLTYTPEQAADLREQSPGLYGDIEREGITVSGNPPWSWGEMGENDRIRKVGAPETRRAISLAKECLEAAEMSLAASRWHAAGVIAIHAGVAAADAALGAAAGFRSASPDHGVVVGLLRESVKGFPAASGRQITGLLRQRNSVYYDARVVTETEARALVDQARRFVEWASGVVDATLG